MTLRTGLLTVALAGWGGFAFGQPVAELYELARSDRTAFARRVTSGASTDAERADRIIDWLGRNFEWTATDYQRRTVEEIIERKGGNCAELATVAQALFDDLGIHKRRVREINVHVESERRQATAERMVGERGNRMSVFGRRHNDHVWLEVYDDESDGWVPVDPSLGVSGLPSWLRARAWFGDRTTLDPGSDAMRFPMAIFVLGDAGTLVENRTRYYMVEELDALYGGALSRLPSWSAWVDALDAIDDLCLGAFQGRINLHDHGDAVAALERIYESLREEHRRSEGR